MNALSLAYSTAQKQQQEQLWIDDPFDLGDVTGVTKMSYNQLNLNDYHLKMVSSHFICELLIILKDSNNKTLFKFSQVSYLENY